MIARRRVDGIIYGPVQSRRFGLSLGINLSGPGKYCSFSCPYCFRGGNDARPDAAAFRAGLPAVDEVLKALQTWLADSGAAHTLVDWTLAGNGEPTDHPEFAAIIRGILELRERAFPQVKVTVLSNGMGLLPRLNPQHRNTAAALGRVDRPCLKLDSALPQTWRRLARPMGGVELPEWLEAAEACPAPCLQTMLLTGRLDNTASAELDALRGAYRRLNARQVYLLTLNKTPADKGLAPVSPETLTRVSEYLGIVPVAMTAGLR